MTYKIFWERLRKIGWLKYEPKENHAKLRALLKESFQKDPDWAHLALTQTGFDAECIGSVGPNERDSYYHRIKELADNSRGLFRPTQIKDELIKLRKSGQAIKISFLHHGLPFCATFPFQGDYFDSAVLDLVNLALKATGIEERFIDLPSPGQLVFLVFVPQKTFDRAILEELIPWPERY